MPETLHPKTAYLLVMLGIFALPWLVWRLARTEDIAPLVVVQIVAGILLGPGIAGALFPALHAQLFQPAVVANLNGLAWWAVIIFLWLAGIELDLKSAWAGRRETAITAGFALATPLLVGAVAAWGLLQWMPGLLGPKASELQFIAALGMGAAVTALPILMLLMEKLGILRTPLGQRVLRYSSLDDIAIWVVLALILVDTDRLLHQVLFLAGFGLLAPLVRRGLRGVGELDRWALGLMWLLACALASDAAGLHFMVGAFLAGVIIDRQWFVEERFDLVRNTVLVFMMPVFFLSTGLRTEWGVGGAAVLVAAAVMLAASVAGKRLGVAIAGRLLGWAPGEAHLIGWLLQTKGLIEIVFATILLDKGVISADAFTALLLMAVASTMLTIPMLRRRLGRQGVPEALREA
ncbi:cation:proton antiporter [Silanimonas lenta]|uniref:cation:proton antiporter n=1 Tax=Silanimonas lenta TaxID=265429 RepID=UPI000413187C|nr:cation:proton antiporter [Silanimonas lenta]